MTDCTGLVVGSRVCIDNSVEGAVVKVFSKYVEVRLVAGPLCMGHTRKFYRRDGWELGSHRPIRATIIVPWDEEKHAPIVAHHELLNSRKNISDEIRRGADRLTLGQIERIREILEEGDEV